MKRTPKKEEAGSLNLETLSKTIPTRSIAYAIQQKCSKVAIQFLLEQGIQITEADMSAAYFAPDDPGKEIFNLLLKSNRLTFYPDIYSQHLAYFDWAIIHGHIETVERSLATLNARQTKIYVEAYDRMSCIKSAIDFKQKEIFKLLSLFYLQNHEVIQAKIGTKQTIFYDAIRHSLVEIVQIILTPPHLKNVNLEQEIVQETVIKSYGHFPSALYWAIETRRITLTNSEKNPKDTDAKKTIESSNEIIRLLLNIDANFGHRSSYFIDQIATIEHFKSTCMTPLYSKAVEAGFKPFSTSGIGSIIAEYAIPDYISHGNCRPGSGDGSKSG